MIFTRWAILLFAAAFSLQSQASDQSLYNRVHIQAQAQETVKNDRIRIRFFAHFEQDDPLKPAEKLNQGHLYSFQVQRLDGWIRVIKAPIAGNSGFYWQDRQRRAREAGH